MEVWKIIFLSKWVICRFHVNLPGCTSKKTPGCCFFSIFLRGRWNRIGWEGNFVATKEVDSAEAMLTKRQKEAEKVHWAMRFQSDD